MVDSVLGVLLGRWGWSVGGLKLKHARRHAYDVDMAAWLESSPFQPATYQADLGLEEAFPTVAMLFDLQSANCRSG